MHARTTIAGAATAALLLTATACDSQSTGQPAPAVTSSAPSSAVPSPLATPPAAPLTFGTTISSSNPKAGSAATVTVLGYEHDVRAHTSADEEYKTSGYVWAAVEIKVCSTKGTVGVTRTPWALAYADGARVEPSSSTYDDFPRPEYPFEADIRNGDCLRGKTVFAVPGKQRPERVLYTSSILPEPAEWAVPPQ
ncbi:hypothetical protein J7I97_24995 [Streptomyces sp. ISL-87]|uniref:hypothetical protein n=1 Tax=Streptomyces sp. ISL-87 TaxID=2819188 RepID=UPI001BEAAA8B|nr:hypothetical protein [Streptomyces sp. ISL-87]MBT2611425.1 hypothetical protein [Streptomyces sp. ISL-87]